MKTMVCTVYAPAALVELTSAAHHRATPARVMQYSFSMADEAGCIREMAIGLGVHDTPQPWLGRSHCHSAAAAVAAAGLCTSR